MKQPSLCNANLLAMAALAVLVCIAPRNAAAHCDTLDGPVIQDARKAIDAKEITPVLKWVQQKDEKVVRAAFKKLFAGPAKNRQAAEHSFFTTLVKIHRAGEGAPFSGLKPAGTVEPAVAAADTALAGGSADALVKLVTDDVAAGIRQRYERVTAAYRHKDESVAQGREFVKAYVAYTHYVERLHRDATAQDVHGEHAGHTASEQHVPHDRNTSRPDHSRH